MISEPALDRLSGMFQRPDVSGTRYELVSVLGRGGMGTVYLARDTVLDREVALKIVERPSDDANEARILAWLEPPRIVSTRHAPPRAPPPPPPPPPPPLFLCGLRTALRFYAMKRVRGDRLDLW